MGILGLKKIFGQKNEVRPIVQKGYVRFPFEKYRIVGYAVTGRYAELMYPSWKEIPMVCPYCHTRHGNIPDLDYKLDRKGADMYSTYDSFCIVSDSFKSFCEKKGYENLKFTKLNECNRYFFEPPCGFRIDIHSPYTFTGYHCPHCGNYTQVCGTIFKDAGFELPSDDYILSSVDYFGSYERKSPAIIVGPETRKKMRKYGLRGLYFTPVFASET